jgi:DNA polymerase III subunit delta'
LQRRTENNLHSLDFIISYSDGIIGTALELADSEEFAEIREKTIKNILRINKAKTIDIFEIYEFFEANKDSLEAILDIMLMFYRDLIAFKETGKENILINYDKKDIILGNVSAFSIGKLVKCVEIVELTRRNIKQNANYQLSIEVMLMKLQED